MQQPKVMVSYGTRPEIIKVAPVIAELHRRKIPCVTVFTGQHRELYEDVRELVPTPDYSLAIMQQNQSLNDIVSRIAASFVPVLRESAPELLIVQGDTSTAAVSALLAFYERIPIGHIEAGLRTFDLSSPFPEEGNRQLISRIARYNWAPTQKAADHLHAEGISAVQVTGNTVVDSCLSFNFPSSYSNKIIITLHRRENFGAKMESQFEQIESLASAHPELEFIFPMHPNPNVQRYRDILQHVKVCAPWSYPQMIEQLSQARFVISDSGGIQEECAAFGKKILVCRDTTERPEGVEAGFARLVDCDIAGNFDWANDNPHWQGTNPFGDGRAAQRIVDTFDRSCCDS
jgi:UDP-N-acetylglucosamine 2-epimerase (non-hydrolysing)